MYTEKRVQQTPENITELFAERHRGRPSGIESSTGPPGDYERAELLVLMQKGEAALLRPGMTAQKLAAHRKDVLQALCTAHGRNLRTDGTKAELATILIDWVLVT